MRTIKIKNLSCIKDATVLRMIAYDLEGMNSFAGAQARGFDLTVEKNENSMTGAVTYIVRDREGEA